MKGMPNFPVNTNFGQQSAIGTQDLNKPRCKKIYVNLKPSILTRPGASLLTNGTKGPCIHK
jgi:hypothetical protein